jgi:plasmid stability protein
MPTMIQVRNVPDDLHRKAKARAALEGLSLSAYLLRELERAVDRPSRRDVLDRLARLPPVKVEPDPAEVIREERDAR